MITDKNGGRCRRSGGGGNDDSWRFFLFGDFLFETKL